MMKVSDFQTKDVVNIVNGKRLGRISDLELDLNQGRVKALVIPGSGRFFGMFQPKNDIVIPWSNIVRIGVDVILVRLEGGESPDWGQGSGELYRPYTGAAGAAPKFDGK